MDRCRHGIGSVCFRDNQDGEKLTGEFNGNKLEGTIKGSAIHFIAKHAQGYTDDVTGTIDNGVIHAPGERGF